MSNVYSSPNLRFCVNVDSSSNVKFYEKPLPPNQIFLFEQPYQFLDSSPEVEFMSYFK